MKPTPPLRFAIIGNRFHQGCSPEIKKVISILQQNNAQIIIDHKYLLHLQQNNDFDFNDISTFDGHDFDADFVISMGGDGTFLTAANLVRDKQIPIIGINLGRLGFLADISSDDIQDALSSIIHGEYTLEERTVIGIDADGKPLVDDNCALNDIAILKRDNASMITIDVKINGEELTTYEADGLIISTTTGSTAYSLSVGGPILVPQMGILSITPVAPHSLNVRPVVVSDASEISISVESRTHQYLVAIDGRSIDCHEGMHLTIRKAPYSVRVVKRNGQSFFKTLRKKLMWGAKFNKTDNHIG